MTREQLNKIFDWLEENMNKGDWLEFKMTAGSNITAKFKSTEKTFAEFYPKQIWKVIEGELDEKEN